jgi:uncharacterized Zn finger protein
MSPWRDWRALGGPKKPPPEHGIRMKKAGTTWWGQRWIEALQSVLSGDAGRLARGRTYARAGRTHDLVVKGGLVTAKVTGSRDEPYEIRIELGVLSDDIWRKALEAMAAKAEFAAELLQGQMPKDIDEAFKAAKSSLFPRRRSELVATCSCPDWGDPCKHVAATHYVLGEAFDVDPFLLFELRGRSKKAVLEALRQARSGEIGPTESGREALEPAGEGAVASVEFGKVKIADYDRPREPLPVLSFSFDEQTGQGALLRQLGAPTTWRAAAPPADTLAPILRAAADRARRLAGADVAAPEPPPAEVRAAPATKKTVISGGSRKKGGKRAKRRIV